MDDDDAQRWLDESWARIVADQRARMRARLKGATTRELATALYGSVVAERAEALDMPSRNALVVYTSVRSLLLELIEEREPQIFAAWMGGGSMDFAELKAMIEQR